MYVTADGTYTPSFAISSTSAYAPIYQVISPQGETLDSGAVYWRDDWSPQIYDDGRTFQYVEAVQGAQTDRLTAAADGSHNLLALGATRTVWFTLEGAGYMTLHIPYRIERSWPAGPEQSFIGSTGLWASLEVESSGWGSPLPVQDSAFLSVNGAEEGMLELTWTRYSGFARTFALTLDTGAQAAPIPEPETWTGLGAGLALVSLAARRRARRGKASPVPQQGMEVL